MAQDKAKGKTIRLYLVDGDPGKLVKCTISNWPGVAYKLPRKDVRTYSKEVPALEQSGIYFVFGKNENDEPLAYIGQAIVRKNNKGMASRILEPHTKDSDNKDFWTDAVMLTTTDNHLGHTELSYLENRFCNLAQNSGRYKVINANDPNIGIYSEETESEMEEFIEYTKIVMGALGYKLLEPYIDPDKTDSSVLYMKVGKYKAMGKVTDDGQNFIVLKGSTINPVTAPSCPPNAKKIREAYDKEIKKGPLAIDVILGSPSAAAAFVSGTSISGPQAWNVTSKGNVPKVHKPSKHNVPDKPKPTDILYPTLYMKHTNGKATGRQISKNEFVIFKGSTIRPLPTKSCRPKVIDAREANAKKIKEGKLIADIILKNANIAACFVGGASLSGNECWHDANGTKLGDLKKQ